MPVVAVGAAAFATATAASTVAAVGFTTLGVLETVAAVGAVIAAVGSVTGNQDMMKIGGAIGLVGGIGSLAVGAGLIGGEAATIGSDAAGAAASGGDAMGDMAAGAAAANEAAASGAGGAMASASPNVFDASTLPDVGSTASTGGILNTPAPAASTAGAAPAAVASPTASAGYDAAGTSPLDAGEMRAVAGWQNISDGKQASSGLFGGIKEYLDPLKAFMKENPIASYAMLQSGGALISGLFDPLKPAQISELEARAAALRAQSAMSSQQQSNLVQPMPIASYGGVRPTGLLNSKVA